MKIQVLITKMAAGACLMCASMAMAADDSLVLDGSTTVGPIAKAFAEYYMGKNPGVNITVGESGSGNGAKSLINGSCQVADLSRAMKDKEFAAAVENGIMPTAHVVAYDGIAIVVHPSNPVKALKLEQVRDIYLGKITNWSEVGGPDRPIVAITRDTNSGTFETFEKLVMDKAKMAASVETVGSNGQARSRVATTAGAVAYIGLGFIDRTVKDLKINGTSATQDTIATGEYAIARPLFMYTNGYPKMGSIVHRFVTLHLTKDGQSMVEEAGFVPVTKY